MGSETELSLATMPVDANGIGLRAGDKVPFIRTTEADPGDLVLCSVLGIWRICRVKKREGDVYWVAAAGRRGANKLAPSDGFVIHGVIVQRRSPDRLPYPQPELRKVRTNAMEPLIRYGEIVKVHRQRRFSALAVGQIVSVKVSWQEQPLIGRLRKTDRGTWLEFENAPPTLLRGAFKIEGVVTR